MSRKKLQRRDEFFKRDPMRYLSHLHIRELYSRLDDLELEKGTRRIFSTDASFLVGQYVGMIQRSNFDEWVVGSARISDQFRLPYYRVIPLADRTYSGVETRKIQYALHTVMALGATVFIPLMEDVEELRELFESHNTLVVEGEFSIAGDHYYDPEAGVRLETDAPDRIELFLPFIDRKWREVHGVLMMRYGKNSFNAGVQRTEALKDRYGHFLALLQSEKCAKCKGHFTWSEWQVDHIYPASRGANTLVNLQLLCRSCNRDKSNRILGEHVRWHVAGAELLEWGLDHQHPYPELGDRKQTENPFGYHFLY